MAFKAMMTGRAPTAFEINEVIEKSLDKVAAEAVERLERLVASWKTRVEFKIIVTRGQRVIETDSDVFNWIDEGTPPHKIMPKNKPMLVFRVGGSPMTQPNVMTSSPGKRGNTLVRSKGVNHPGTKPRNFTMGLQLILDARLEKTVEDDLQFLIDQLAES